MTFLPNKARSAAVVFLAAASVQWYGCAGPPDAAQSNPNSPRQDEPAATVVDARPAALVNGRSVMWGELRAQLSERAGSEILRELILDRAIDDALASAGITISPADIEAERELLQRTLNDDGDVAVRLLEELRARQGLGPKRFNALMYRNAALRSLVSDRVEVTEGAVQRMHEMVHGPKRQARLMILPTLSVAQRAKERLEEGEFFGDIAVELSTDASASRGGLLEPISRADGSYPEAMRKALWSLKPGELSRPILLDDQYALLMLVREIEGDDVELENVRAEMQQHVRHQQERALMDQLAGELVRNVSVTIFDDSLHESWRMRRHGRR